MKLVKMPSNTRATKTSTRIFTTAPFVAKNLKLPDACRQWKGATSWHIGAQRNTTEQGGRTSTATQKRGASYKYNVEQEGRSQTQMYQVQKQPQLTYAGRRGEGAQRCLRWSVSGAWCRLHKYTWSVKIYDVHFPTCILPSVESGKNFQTVSKHPLFQTPLVRSHSQVLFSFLNMTLPPVYFKWRNTNTLRGTGVA